MGVLSNIFSKIFPSSHAAPAQAPTNTAPAPEATAANQAAAPGVPPSAAAPAMSEVDVEAVLNGLAQKNPQKLNWRSSIVDLLKLLDLDNSLAARKELAQELNYTGDMSDSATMNIWLHKQVMNKLAANGGRVPADLKD
ncbi:DUF3597 domain-containing protein [Noviherbaspirillum saxi]|uniref:DUF3597 domain-containing protein n=1 Tax=Noviherbaspirillum saxi TaxID=2320863 RepID=A0A3A3G1U6_9BURK|nr:DUF3597 domain-containing protein [Noviherbaspirillum saxi]RJF92043.1 DUF3597 domain-containing protein [Noviherbaspirillum saxi]